jgi:CHAT domain-containing protein
MVGLSAGFSEREPDGRLASLGPGVPAESPDRDKAARHPPDREDQKLGARSLLLSLWRVDDTATALLMKRFYENLLGRREGLRESMPRAAALQEAKHWLRSLRIEDVERLLPLSGRDRGSLRPVDTGKPGTLFPFAHPYYWSAFILTGDPR